jgi:pyruvate/2-oxoglutarate dehydrogenase complex dihydrolipoamide dehydrogenase (E3) component
VRRSLTTAGVSIHENAGVTNVASSASGIDVRIETALGITQVVSGTHLLVAAGRKPNISGLGLDAAEISTTELPRSMLN